MLDRLTPSPMQAIQTFNPTKARVGLPTFHPKQVELFRQNGKRKVARCGRRWGKNVFGESIAASDALKGRLVGWFAPEHKRLTESYNVIADYLEQIKKRSNKTDGMIETIRGGKVEFWSLEDENAGRSRKYHRIIIDEFGFAKPSALDTWTRAIEPTLLDYDGSAIIMSNTNGIAPDNPLRAVCPYPGEVVSKYGFVDFHAPTYSNPLLPLRKPLESHADWLARRAAYFAELVRKTPPLVYQQEYLADFVDWSGAAFFTRDSLLVNGQPVEMPARCEAVFAVIDTATKTGKQHDGTGLIWFAVVQNHVRLVGPDGKTPPRYSLVILDWDLRQIEGALLETWLPTVFQQGEELARRTGAARGSLGAMIEDKASGMVLLQQAARRGWPAFPIESKLTSLGKDERAISVSGYVYQGLVKISRPAYEKVMIFKEVSANHMLSQITGFRIGDPDAAKRSDDLVDCLTYGCAVALGNEEGF